MLNYDPSEQWEYYVQFCAAKDNLSVKQFESSRAQIFRKLCAFAESSALPAATFIEIALHLPVDEFDITGAPSKVFILAATTLFV